MVIGSGTDRHRPEYGTDVPLTSASADGSRLIKDNWSGLRQSYCRATAVSGILTATVLSPSFSLSTAIIFQTFEFPLAAFMAVNPAFNPQTVTQVQFLFDQTPAAVVALDEIGLRNGDGE